MALILRDYQEELIRKTRQALRTNRQVLMQAPTGAGKTALACTMIRAALEKGIGCMFVVHQNELLNQTSKALWANKIEHGMIVSGRGRTPHLVQLASVLTLVNRTGQYKAPGLIIIDEAHRAVANSYQKVLEAYPDAFVVGLTATPERTDGKGLNHIFGGIVQGPAIRWLIEQGFLCDYELFSLPQHMSMQNVRTTAGDYNTGDLEKEANKPSITGDAVAHYKKLAGGLKCVVMCVSIAHAEAVAESYNAQGVKAEAVHGKTANRDEVLDRFSNGDTMVLTSVQLMIEGVDLPVIAAVQWLRPTQSLVVYMQGNGRGLRTHAGKSHLIILDHVGNYLRHGWPCEERDWSLEGRQKGKRSGPQETRLAIRVCERCFFAIRHDLDHCSVCGEVVKIKQREIEIKEGELEKVKAIEREAEEKKQARIEQGKARTLEELVALGADRKLANAGPWAANVYASRMGRKATTVEYKNAKAILRRLTQDEARE